MGFLGVWLAPLAALRKYPSCVFHCYACPLASFACPIGVMANSSALHVIPFLTLGVVIFVAALVGSLVCGWVCPFGFLQDLLGKIPTPKFRLPAWSAHFRYVVLVGLVFVLPWWLGAYGIQYGDQGLSICRICPAGAVEGTLPRVFMGDISISAISALKWCVLGLFVFAALFTHRPWCKVFCPLGGLLSLFNRVSVFHLRFVSGLCKECNLCRTYCRHGVHLDKSTNDPGCIRCMECSLCGAISPSMGMFDRNATPDDRSVQPQQDGDEPSA